MITQKRSRGRPAGTGKQDGGYLARVADQLLADPQLKPTTAIKRIIYKRPDQTELDATLVRRLQGKWKLCQAEFLEAARARKEAQEAKMAPAPRQGWSFSHGFNAEAAARMLEATRPLRELMQSPAFQQQLARQQKLREQFMASPAFERMTKWANSPAAKLLADWASSPAAKRLEEFASSPAAENMRKNLERIERAAPLLPSPK